MGEIDQFHRIMINTNRAMGRPLATSKALVRMLLVVIALIDATSATQLKQTASATGQVSLKTEVKAEQQAVSSQ